MPGDDDYYDDDDALSDAEAGDGEGGAGPPPRPEDAGVRNWMDGRRGWTLIIALALVQGIFALIMMLMRSDARPAMQVNYRHVRDLAVDMLGHEVDIRQIHQVVPLRGGRRMTVGLDVVLVLGQLPEERVEGSERPTEEEFAVFIETVRGLEPNIRSRVNILLQRMPPEAYGTVEAGKTIREDIQQYVNDALERLDFGGRVRPMIGTRRVTGVLLPMFIRQMM